MFSLSWVGRKGPGILCAVVRWARQCHFSPQNLRCCRVAGGGGVCFPLNAREESRFCCLCILWEGRWAPPGLQVCWGMKIKLVVWEKMSEVLQGRQCQLKSVHQGRYFLSVQRFQREEMWWWRNMAESTSGSQNRVITLSPRLRV